MAILWLITHRRQPKEKLIRFDDDIAARGWTGAEVPVHIFRPGYATKNLLERQDVTVI